MEDLLKFLEQVWNAAGFPGVAALFGLVVAALGSGLPVVWGLVVKLWQFRQQRKLQRDLFPFYSKQDIQRATQYYVETSCQNIAPSKEDEPRQTHAFATKQKILPFFLKQAFKPDKDDCQFYMVLADSGMGKTTFLINLYLRYTDQFVKPPYKIRLLPLAAPDVDKEIEAIKDDEKKQTILLLDAFNEDIKAIQNYQSRLEELIRKIWKFREVVITCRTEFFPAEEEEPKETGILQFGGKGGIREFRKVYLSPFDDDNINTYLNKRFAIWHWRKKRKARQIVAKCPNLMVRPMLLSHIDDLLGSDSPYTAPYMVYGELIHKWIEREAKKAEPMNPETYHEKLFEFSRAIAVDMYRKREERQGRLLIPAAEIQPFADSHSVRLSDMEMKSRSLLNRNAQGEYKFSHKSILEYFLAEEALFNAHFRKELNFDGMDQARTFFQEMVWEQHTLPMLKRGGLRGEYTVKDEKPKPLSQMNIKHLPNITSLKLYTWNSTDDVLVFIGLKELKQLDLSETQFSAIQSLQDIQYLCPSKFSTKLPPALEEKVLNPYRSGNLVRDIANGKTNMFYGRHDTIRKLKEILIDDDDNLAIIYGQRRTGKSCLMRYIEKTRKFEPDLRVIFIDMQRLSSEQDFYDCVLHNIMLVTDAKGIVSHANSFNEFAFALSQILPTMRHHILLMLDEFEIVTAEHFKYTSLASANEFIHNIRHLIQHTPHIKFVLAGADGLRTMINDYNNPLFKAGRTLHLAFLRPSEAKDLITQPLLNIVDYKDSAIISIQEATCNHPYYIQCLCQRIVAILKEQGRYVVAQGDVEQAIKEWLKEEHDMFEHVWNITAKDAHVVLAILAQEMVKEQWIHIDRIQQIIVEYHFQIQRNIFDGPIKQLVQKDLLSEGNAGLEYRIPMGLLVTWLRQHKSIERVRRECEL